MEEQAADFRRAFEIGCQRQRLVAEDLAELGTALGQRTQMVAVKGLDDTDLAEHLAGAADFAALQILEHEDVEVAALLVAYAAERRIRSGELGDQGRTVGRQVGEPATGELRHLVDGLEVIAVCRADAEAHAASAARRRMVSADNAARSFRLSTIRNSSML